MTPKAKLKSLEKKMERLQSYNSINLKEASRYFHDIERYYNLRQEHFHLEFEINHCQTCGKPFKNEK